MRSPIALATAITLIGSLILSYFIFVLEPFKPKPLEVGKCYDYLDNSDYQNRVTAIVISDRDRSGVEALAQVYFRGEPIYDENTALVSEPVFVETPCLPILERANRLKLLSVVETVGETQKELVDFTKKLEERIQKLENKESR